MSIQWRNEMSVDGSVIDEDHQHLIALVNAFEKVINKRMTQEILEQGLAYLKHYTLVHFAREEELQRAAQYPFYEAHHKEHKDLVRKLDAFALRFKERRTDQELGQITREMVSLLREWLVGHIIQSDLRMRPYVNAMKPYIARMKALRDHPGS